MKKLLLVAVIAVMNIFGGKGLEDCSNGKTEPKIKDSVVDTVCSYISQKTDDFVREGSCHGFEGACINIKLYQKQQRNRLEHREIEAKPMYQNEIFATQSRKMFEDKSNNRE